MGTGLTRLQQDLLAILHRHEPYCPKEAGDLVTIKALVRAYPDIMRRECLAGHVTGSALVLDEPSGRILLHHHKRLDRWLQLGGHADPGETDPAQTAYREAVEECGLADLRFAPHEQPPYPLDIDVHCIPARGTEPMHLHLDFRYLLVTAQPDRLWAAAGESRQFRWLSVDEALALDGLDSGLRRMIRKTNRVWRHMLAASPVTS